MRTVRIHSGILVLFALLASCVGGAPIPSRADLLKAEPEVRKATKELLADLVRGETTRSEVAEAVRIMGSQSADPAEEYLFLQGAFRLFVRAGEFPRATEVLRHMRSREFPVEALVNLAERALEPVPRGVDTGGLDESLKILRDDFARTRRQKAESGIAQGLQTVRVPEGNLETPCTPPEFLEQIRNLLHAEGKPVFHYVLRCPLIGGREDDFPLVAAEVPTNATLAAAWTRFCTVGGCQDRVHGPLRFLTHAESFAATSPMRSVPFAGDAEDLARRLKRIRLGFVAVDGNETLDEAIERLLRAVVDQGRASDQIDFDVILRNPSLGRFPHLRTLRAVDTTLFDALALICRGVDYKFEIRGNCVLISSL